VRILWVSNSPLSHSGYGSQTRQVGRRLLAAGYDVEFSANDGSRAGTWEGATVRGSGFDQYSRDKVREDIERSGADWTIVLYDPWVYMQAEGDPFAGNPRVLAWAPVDHYPTPPSMTPWLYQHGAIAMSQFGHQALAQTIEAGRQRKGYERGFPLYYAPHAIEPVFRPTPSDFRRSINVPEDAYVVGIVAANTGGQIYDRKGWGDMLAGAAWFMESHPDAYLYLHTQLRPSGGIPLQALVNFVPGLPVDRIRWADQYRMKDDGYTDADMAAVYSGLDVLLATSRGEGFGIPVIEAQACGTPVIVSNWTAQPELVGEPWAISRMGRRREASGWVVSVDPDFDLRHASFFGKPIIADINGALADAYAHRGDPDIKAAAIAKAAEYDADRVFDAYWRPILADMERALTEKPNRAQRRAARKAKVAA